MSGTTGDRGDRLAGVLLGTALGDALGLPMEGLSARTIARRFGRVDRFYLIGKTGFVSDDTEQAALVAQSLARSPGDVTGCVRAFRKSLLGWFLRPHPAGWSLSMRDCNRIRTRGWPVLGGWVLRKFLLVLSLAAIGCGDPEKLGTPEEVFRVTFGRAPGPTIVGLKGSGSLGRDWATCFLTFQVSPAEWNGLIGPTFATITREEFVRALGGEQPIPRAMWWAPGGTPPTVCQTSSAFHPGFAQGVALMSYDPTTQVAHVYWRAVD